MPLNIAETLLPQPPSFQKKKAYEIHKVLGVGTFGKVMVCAAHMLLLCMLCTHLTLSRSHNLHSHGLRLPAPAHWLSDIGRLPAAISSGQHGTSRPAK